ncbi:nucleotidyltransferase domain-containing protein [Proteiniclasticum sp. BAD-10]|uniref:Nucleotidyltransferase domain-containing protein n=1 Tax=Proteiniclasticum sediminis TaxID=2804028 RepID=A0A941CTH2_9CLOT|nr:nucleotidyltransferase domain-containing protein [Proteiniclasticum sediminis]MBR0577279.1 nucleotidyltransferase domain-containing protein [Proteiniclasticum sediminis]
MNSVNQKIIDAVIEKAEKVCPDSLALIGIYGSVARGDEYEKSDLDLLILIQNDEGWQLGTGFILQNSKVGYDIYCTNWDRLRYDAACHHAQLSRMIDSKIVFIKNQQAYDELCNLREQAKLFLASEERFQRVNKLVDKAKVSYANAYLHEELGQVRLDAFGVIHSLMDAIMLFHGSYFKRSTKSMLEELAALPIEEFFVDHIKSVAASKDVLEIRALLKSLLLYTEVHLKQKRNKAEPSASLAGTYEEMYSNWRNKVEEAAKQNNVFASFMNMCSLQNMLIEISDEVAIGTYNIMEEYNPDCLEDNVSLFDACLQEYEKVYETAGIAINYYPSVDEFVADYLKN